MCLLLPELFLSRDPCHGSPLGASVDITSHQGSDSFADKCLQDTMSDEVKDHMSKEGGDGELDYQASSSSTVTVSNHRITAATSDDLVQAVSADGEHADHVEAAAQRPYDYDHPPVLTTMNKVMSMGTQDNSYVNIAHQQTSNSRMSGDPCLASTDKHHEELMTSRYFPETCSGEKKALLIACTYKHVQRNDPDIPDPDLDLLNYSHKDPESLKQLLIDHEYKEENISILIDDGDNPETYPTRDNIINHIHKLVDDAQAGDWLFIHFSGHGGQTTAIKDKFEIDNMDELIYPCDYLNLKKEGKVHFILDDLLREILVDPVPAGCRLVALFDCCSSGTVLDLPVTDEGFIEVHVGNQDELWLGKPPSVMLPSDLVVERGGRAVLSDCSVVTEEPDQDPSLSLIEDKKPVNPRIRMLRNPNAKERNEYRRLDRDAIVSGQGTQAINRSDSDGSFMNKALSLMKRDLSTQLASIRSQSLPLYARRVHNRDSLHVLPLMNPRGIEGVNEKALQNIVVPADNRVINGDVLCLASCRDSGQTYETSLGGVLVQAVCEVLNTAKKDKHVLTLGEVKTSLRQQLKKTHNNAMEGKKTTDSNFNPDDFTPPIPQFSSSHRYHDNSKFIL